MNVVVVVVKFVEHLKREDSASWSIVVRDGHTVLNDHL
jgi:hypothetical protein